MSETETPDLEWLADFHDRMAPNSEVGPALRWAAAEIERLTDEVDGLEADLSSALDVIARHGNEKALIWLALNYPNHKTHEDRK